MNKSLLILAAGLASTSIATAALTDATTPWGAKTTNAAEQSFVDYIGNTQNTGYAHPGLSTRSASEKAEGLVEAITTATEDIAGDDLFINLLYAGGSTNHVREFGFDISYDGMSAEVLLTDPLAGKTASKIPFTPADLGRVFSMSVKDIITLVGGDIGDANAAGGVSLDFFSRKVAIGNGNGLDGQKVLASEGIAVFDYTPFVDPAFGSDPYDDNGVVAGTGGEITSIPGGFPEGLSRVWGWEDQIVQDGGSYKLGGVDADFNDFIMTLSISNQPITTAVPEPSTYGLIGAAALVGLIVRRRLKAKKS